MYNLYRPGWSFFYRMQAGKPKKQHHAHEKKESYAHREISLWLDSYDDIFSDFDPRPYTQRNISEDFLDELKKISQETEARISAVKFLLPEKKRNAGDEAHIHKRLSEHFKNAYHDQEDKIRSLRVRSVSLIIVAILLMIAATYISSVNSTHFLKRVLFVITEPAGWFLMWTGLENLFAVSRKLRPDLFFNEKLVRSKIQFESI